MNDEELYLAATNEVEGENKSPGLWAKVMTLSEGDEEKAKYKYVKLRVEQLSEEGKNEAPTFTKKTVDELDLKYLPVAEFAKIKSIPIDKVIKMIRGGFYQGQIIDDKWYVAYSEVSNAGENSSSESGGFFSKLTRGYYGLPKTYWLFGALGNLLLLFPIAVAVAAESMPILVLAIIASVVYSLAVLVGIWKASDKYLGPKLWAVLAKIAVIFGIFNLFAELILLDKPML